MTTTAIIINYSHFVRNQGAAARDAVGLGGRSLRSEKGEVLPRGVGTLRYSLILSETSACQVPICAVAA